MKNKLLVIGASSMLAIATVATADTQYFSLQNGTTGITLAVNETNGTS
jgi:hypothetical protein